jgi:hypothetical protein
MKAIDDSSLLTYAASLIHFQSHSLPPLKWGLLRVAWRLKDCRSLFERLGR